MKFRCARNAEVSVSEIVPNPRNPNKHTPEQIERLAKIIGHQGQRSPIVVSQRSGLLVVGHGRLEAIKKLGWEKIAVDYQDFVSDAQEYEHLCADNAIAEWATLDLSQINFEIPEFGPELNIEMLGLKNFTIDFGEKVEAEEQTESTVKMTTCPNCGEEFNPKAK